MGFGSAAGCGGAVASFERAARSAAIGYKRSISPNAMERTFLASRRVNLTAGPRLPARFGGRHGAAKYPGAGRRVSAQDADLEGTTPPTLEKA